MFRFLIQFLKSAFSDEFFIVTALMVRDTGSICLFLKEFPAQNAELFLKFLVLIEPGKYI